MLSNIKLLSLCMKINYLTTLKDKVMKTTLTSVIGFMFGLNANFTKENLRDSLRDADFLYDVERDEYLNNSDVIEWVFENLNKVFDFNTYDTEYGVEVVFDNYSFYMSYETYEAFKNI